MTVYIPNRSKHDLDLINKYGAPVLVFTKNLFPDNIDADIKEETQRAATVLVNFDPARDYLCLTGSPLFISICIQILVQLDKCPIRLLRYDHIEDGYYPVTLPTREETFHVKGPKETVRGDKSPYPRTRSVG